MLFSSIGSHVDSFEWNPRFLRTLTHEYDNIWHAKKCLISDPFGLKWTQNFEYLNFLFGPITKLSMRQAIWGKVKKKKHWPMAHIP